MKTRLSAQEFRALTTKLVDELGAVYELKNDRHEFTVEPDQLITVLGTCKEAGLLMVSDIFGIDYLEYPQHDGKRFSVLYNLHDIAATSRVYIRVNLNDEEPLPTATGLWKGANFLEREVFDMFGVVFEGHPDLRKLLTPEDLEGHPHRKDFPLGESPTLFNDGRFLDPTAFRAGLTGGDVGLTGWKGGQRISYDRGEE